VPPPAIAVTTGAGTATAPGTFYVNPCPQVSLKQALAGNTSDAGVSTPTIYKVKPTSGAAGATVDITGSNMLHVRGVFFGSATGAKAKFTISTPTHIIAIVPKGEDREDLPDCDRREHVAGWDDPTNAAGNSRRLCPSRRAEQVHGQVAAATRRCRGGREPSSTFWKRPEKAGENADHGRRRGRRAPGCRNHDDDSDHHHRAACRPAARRLARAAART
jgi:hypothetical protein